MRLTLDQIQARATSSSFSRGQSYYKQSAIFDTVQRGNHIEGFCEASSQPDPYHIQVEMDESGIVDASCTCEYDYGGDCKHIVALLLTYLYEPERFEQAAPIEDTLAARDKEDLIILIRQMVEQYPDLQALVDRPVPARTARKVSVDTAGFRKEMRRALTHSEGWGDRTAERTIRSIMRTADTFAQKGDWHNASVIYRALLEECTSDKSQAFPDDDGELFIAVSDALDSLAELLNQPEMSSDDEERRAILDTLLSAYIWDVEMGGFDAAPNATEHILRYARQSDLASLRETVGAAQRRKAAQSYGDWAAEDYAAFLIELDALDNTDPEATLERLRQEGMYSLLVGKLLELKRVDEAIAIISQYITAPYERLTELPRLVALGREEDAIRLAKESLHAKYDSQTAGWLLERYKARGDWQAYVQLQKREMWAAPAEHNYALLKEAAQKTGQWETLRAEVLAWLQSQKQLATLIKVYLHDEEWDAAWDALDKYNKAPKNMPDLWMYSRLDLEVAKRSGKARPQKAIPIYIQSIRQEIAQRDRVHYQAAADLLLTVRALYQQIKDMAAWQTLISGIRTEFPKLRALQDELNKAGL